MTNLKINIFNFEDNSNPGWVKCSFKDVNNKEWYIIEKIPVVTEEYLDENSVYPVPGLLQCKIVKSYMDSGNKRVVTADISSTYL